MPIEIPFSPADAERVIEDFIKTYVEISGASGVVIGLSGGVDSAVVAVLCQRSLGKERVKCLFLPDRTTPKIDAKHKDMLVEKFDLDCREIEITDLVKSISERSPEKPDKIALANVKARLRMLFLYEYANATKSIVCGTSNKSELLIGYFTKYGGWRNRHLTDWRSLQNSSLSTGEAYWYTQGNHQKAAICWLVERADR